METIAFDPLAVLRVLCGMWFIPHCIGKIRHGRPASQTFAKAGLHPPTVFVILTIVLEVIAGLGLVQNIQARLAAALAVAVAVLAGTSYAVLKINGFNWRRQKQGPEFMVFWAAACILSVSG